MSMAKSVNSPAIAGEAKKGNIRATRYNPAFTIVAA